MRTIALQTRDGQAVKDVQIPNFIDIQLPDVVTWGVRTFMLQRLDFQPCYRRDGEKYIPIYTECFAVAVAEIEEPS